MAIYLGLDCGTQSLSALAIEVDGAARKHVVFERSIEFDAEFPQYHTHHGVVRNDDPLMAASSPVMWADALDRMMSIVAADRSVDLGRIRAISGSAQQHGSVYLNADARSGLTGLDPKQPLATQVPPWLSRPDAPIWMDASTAAQCAAITEAIGGADTLARLTGSRAFERFTGPQIRKFAESQPAAYARTDRVHLVSSYLASLLAGSHAPIDPGDGAGTNLMDIRLNRWAPQALRATAPGLEGKLPAIQPSSAVVGTLAPYWVKRYGFPPARVIAWSGDNPCSLIGTGIVREGRVAISLGTSDTLFGYMPEPRIDPDGAGHVFGAPTGDCMGLICCRNGSLARERVRNDAGLDWEGFSAALRNTAPGNRGGIMLPWFEPEITPLVHTPGVRRYGLDPADGAANVRAVVEGQMLALALHSGWMGAPPGRIHATGGGAQNVEILQVMADVHNAEVCRSEVENSACLGATLRAYHADRLADGDEIPWDSVIAGIAEPSVQHPVRPVAAHAAIYRELRRVYAVCEAHAMLSSPPARQRSRIRRTP